MSTKSESPFSARLRARLIAMGWSVSRQDARVIQRAFVEALKEEVEARYGPLVGAGATDPLSNRPLRIAGLGSFKMKTRPQRTFDSFRYAQAQSVFGNDGIRPRVTKPPARRLVFTAKWEKLP